MLVVHFFQQPSVPCWTSKTMFNRAIRIPTASLRGIRSFSASTRTAKVYENVDAATFTSRVLKPSGAEAEVPVLVDFFATWCQPCKLLSPALKKVATQKDLVGKEVDLVTIDVDQHQDIAQQFKVSAMPTVIAMKNGKVLDGFVGMLPEKKVIEFVQNLN